MKKGNVKETVKETVEKTVCKKVLINSIEKVKQFCTVSSEAPFDVDLISGRYTIDAKSIMGIFSLNLSNPIEMIAHCDITSDQGDKFFKDIAGFIVD